MDPNHAAANGHEARPDCPACREEAELDEMFATLDAPTDGVLSLDAIVHAADGLDPASPLATLIEEANRLASSSETHFRSAREHIRDGLRDAVAAGAHLTAIHDQLPRGSWGPWLDEGFCMSPSLAYSYMDLWKERVLVADYLKLQSSVSLTASIDGALQFIRRKRAEAKLLAAPPTPAKSEYYPFMFNCATLLDIAALAEKLMDVSPPEEWWAAMKMNAWKFKKEPDRAFWRRFGEAIVAMSEAPDPPEEEDDWPDLAEVKHASQYGPVTKVWASDD